MTTAVSPPSPLHVTVVDDDLVTCELLCEVFAQEGFVAEFAQSVDAALERIASSRPDVLVSDINMSGRNDGLSLLAKMRADYPSTPVVLITAFGSVDTAVRAVKDGAFDYVSKPFDLAALVATVRRAGAANADAPAEAFPDNEPVVTGEAPQLLGRSPGMLDVYKLVAHVSDSSAAVVITGESGTGKELVARAIHRSGIRQNQPFVAVNCGALTETLLESELFGHVRGAFTGAVSNRVGLFEHAREGTVFLDEIGETSAALQVKLLRVLQEREIVPVGGAQPLRIQARVIAATNADLEELSERGVIRRDLLYRLNVITIHVPPLRDRGDDILLLASHFLRKHTAPGASVPALSAEARQVLMAAPWPGNVRQLENVIQRAVTLSRGGTITADDFPATLRIVSPAVTAVSGPEAARSDGVPRDLFAGLPSLDQIERRYLEHVLDAVGGNRSHAAQILGIDRRTLYRMASRFGMDLQ